MPKTRVKHGRGLPVGTRVKFRGFSRIYGTVIQLASHTGANGGLRQKVRMERTGRVFAWHPAELIAVEGENEKA